MKPRRHRWSGDRRLRAVLRGNRWLCALLLGASLAAQATSITVRDDRGRVVELPRPPMRIVSLLPSATETVCALQACERLVGVDRFSDWPAQVRELPRVGGLEDAQLERVVALKPDLVLTGPFARAVDRLEALGVAVLVLEAKDLSDVHRVLEATARALGSPGAGEGLWQSLNERIDAAAARVPAQLRGQRVYFEVAPGPFAAGESSFVGQILARLALGNIVPVALGPFPKLNPEFVVRARPDWIMASERDFATMAGRPGWEHLEALRGGRHCVFSEEFFPLLLRPGPRLGEGAEAIAACLAGADERRGSDRR
ncbi:MAG: ABC transporter substrate-binding protein [Burkholderiaceae bacterium]|nr:ABC transporter substrate-binding protein [Burkholderiaceae bacterium]